MQLNSSIANNAGTSMEFSYEVIDSTNRIYKFNYYHYHNCLSGWYSIGNPENIYIKSLGSNAFNGDTLAKVAMKCLNHPNGYARSQACPGSQDNCATGVWPPVGAEGYQLYVWEAYFTFPKIWDKYLIYHPEAAYWFYPGQLSSNYDRLFVNPYGGGNSCDFVAQATIDFSKASYNNSPTNPNINLIPVFCKNKKVIHSFNSIDPDGDSLVYNLKDIQVSTFTPTYKFGAPFITQPHINGTTTQHPTLDCGYSWNSQTGEYKWKPDTVQFSQIDVRIDEYRNSQLIGSSERIAIYIVKDVSSCSEIALDSALSPSCTLFSKSSNVKDSFGCYINDYVQSEFVFCEKTPMTINFRINNKQKKIVKLDNYAGYGSAVDLDTSKVDSIRDFRLTWSNPIYGKHYGTFAFTGCPDTGIYNTKFDNYITLPFTVLRTPRPHRDTLFYCAIGGAKDLYIRNLDSGVTVDWSHHSGFTYSNADSSHVKIALTHDTTYYIYYKYYGTSCPSCNMIDTVVVKFVPDFSHTTLPLTSTVCISSGSQVTIKGDSMNAPYSYAWTPMQRIFHPITGLLLDSASSATIGNPRLKPFVSSTYYVEITSKTGCTVLDSARVNVVDSAINFSIQASKKYWCNCDTAQLQAVSNTFVGCSLQDYPINNPISYSITSGSSSPYPIKPYNNYPSIFGGHGGKSVKHRILIKNAELKAMGVAGKNIKSLSFYTDTVKQVKYKNLQITMACSAEDTIRAAFVPTTVFYRDSLILLSDMEYILPLKQFGYNVGLEENLFIEICFKNDTNYVNANSQLEVQTTAYPSVAFTYGNNVCASYTWLGTSNLRPKIKFGKTSPNPSVPSTYNWSPNIGLSSNIISNPVVNRCAPIMYTLTAGKGVCSMSDSIFIQADTILNITARKDTFICSKRTVQLNADAIGSPIRGSALTYLWRAFPKDSSLKDSTSLISLVSPDTTTSYIIYITNGACIKSDTVTITVGTPLKIAMSKKDPTCLGANGKAIAKSNNGNAPFNYIWSPFNVNHDTIQSLLQGKYKVTVLAADGCEGRDSVTLVNIQKTLSISLSKTDVTCFGKNDGRLKASVLSAETGPFQYTWIPSLGNSDSFSTLNAGWHKVTILDTPSNCIGKDSIEIKQAAKLIVQADSIDVSCYGMATGSLTTATVGGTLPYSYSWSDTSLGNVSSAINKVAKTYSVTVTDKNGCRDSSATKINQPNELITSLYKTDSVQCYGDSNGVAIIQVTGGTYPYSYTWLNGSGQIDSNVNTLKKGIYTVVIKDKFNCLDSIKSIAIGSPDSISIDATVIQNFCFGQNAGKIKLNVRGGRMPYSYLWSDNSIGDTIANLQVGTYSVTVKDNSLCSQVKTFIITQPTLIKRIIQTDSVRCFNEANGKAVVHISGGIKSYTYNWNALPIQTDSIAIGLKQGMYLLNASDSNGCMSLDTVLIRQPQPLVSAIQADSVTCFNKRDGLISMQTQGGNGNYSYTNNGMSVFFPMTNLDTGSYFIITKDAKQCADTQIVRIYQAPKISGFMITDSIRCASSKNGKSKVVATGGTGKLTYQWTNGSLADSAINLVKGKVEVTISDIKNCQAIFIDTVKSPPAINIVFKTGESNCKGSSTGYIKAMVGGGAPPYLYQWNTSPILFMDSISQIKAGIYQLKITDSKGCEDTLSAILSEPISEMEVILKTKINATCYKAGDGQIEVMVKGGLAPYQYKWNTNPAQFTALAKNLSANELYTVTVTDQKGCEDTMSFSIAEPQLLTIDKIELQHVQCPKDQNGFIKLTMKGGTVNATRSYQLSTDSVLWISNRMLQNLSGGIYKIWVRDANGCIATTQAEIKEPELLIVQINP
ncbi:MAG: SprB repeat-containing protein [Bacteroidetes bacterium]|nr:SprB repeat-containing protein [Bacteroidota bacterium]